MIAAAAGSRLAHSAPANAVIAEILHVELSVEVTRLIICNISADAATFRLYHSHDNAFDVADALWYDQSVESKKSFEWGAYAGSGIQLRKGDRLAFRSSVAGALACHVYGVAQSIAPPGSTV